MALASPLCYPGACRAVPLHLAERVELPVTHLPLSSCVPRLLCVESPGEDLFYKLVHPSPCSWCKPRSPCWCWAVELLPYGDPELQPAPCPMPGLGRGCLQARQIPAGHRALDLGRGATFCPRAPGEPRKRKGAGDGAWSKRRVAFYCSAARGAWRGAQPLAGGAGGAGRLCPALLAGARSLARGSLRPQLYPCATMLSIQFRNWLTRV